MKNAININPLHIITKRFTPVDIIYDRDCFVIAKGVIDGKNLGLACRWHMSNDIGYPNGFGNPQWMILPHQLEDVHQVEKNGGKSLRMHLTMEESDIRIGSIVYMSIDEVYGVICDTDLPNDMCLLDSVDYEKPTWVSTSHITNIINDKQTALDIWHNMDIKLWLSTEGYLYLTHGVLDGTENEDGLAFYKNNVFQKTIVIPVTIKGKKTYSTIDAEEFTYLSKIDGDLLLMRFTGMDHPETRSHIETFLETFDGNVEKYFTHFTVNNIFPKNFDSVSSPVDIDIEKVQYLTPKEGVLYFESKPYFEDKPELTLVN